MVFGLSFWEIVVILGVITLFVGPAVVGRFMGKSFTSLRKGAVELSDQIVQGIEQPKLPPPSDDKDKDPPSEDRRGA